MLAIRFDRTGGPEVLQLVEVPTPAPGPGEILIRHRAIGVNFSDLYPRSGQYPALYPVTLPGAVGLEAAGVVEAVGTGVTRFAPGDRAGYCLGPTGAYAQFNVVPEARAVRIPSGIEATVAAASMMKGMTARYLLKKTHPVKAGDVILLYAAAGGVGSIAAQWASALGATVIGVVGSERKVVAAKHNGCAHVIDSSREDIVARVREITNGVGVGVVYDSVGKDSFEASLNSLAPLGLFVSFGNVSGMVPDINARVLNQKGSLFFTRPGLVTYTRTPQLLQETADDLFEALSSGIVKMAPPRCFELAQAAEAQRALEAREITGTAVLIC